MKRQWQLFFVAVLLPLFAWFGLYGESLSLDVLQGLITMQDMEVRSSAVQKPTLRASIFQDDDDNADDDLFEEEQNDGRPLFLLHVGPSKTGTTTIQWFAGQNKQLMEQDGVYYLGPGGKGSYNVHDLRYQCRAQADSNCEATWKEFGELVEYHYKLNHTVMISEEKFACKFLDQQDEEEHLWKYLTPLLRKWRVRVLFSYRRFYEWVPSKYMQAFNPDSVGQFGKDKKENWPGARGRPIPSFPEYLDDFLQRKNFKHPSQLAQRWEAHYPGVQIYNFHEDGEFLQTFFCQMVPEAPQLCEYMQKQDNDITKNPSASKSLHFDMLAVGAYKRGWVEDGLKRPNVTKAVQEFSKELGYESMMEFPLECLSDSQIDLLLEHSLSLEEELVPDFYLSQKGYEELRAGFDSAKAKGKFCSVDVDEVLKDERWQQFFQSLGGGSKSKSVQIPKSKSQVAVTPLQKKTSILTIFAGDEGSTAMSEVLRQHPQVYSPDWAIEPVDRKQWKDKEFAIKPMLEAIRFLLRMPSSDTEYSLGGKKPITDKKYRQMVGSAEATYLKARVCRNLHKDKDTYRECLEEALDDLLCGEPDDILDHLILPVRYGFDRVCSIFVHRHKEIYNQVSQFNNVTQKDIAQLRQGMDPDEADWLEEDQEMYIDNFLDLLEIAQNSCPGQKHKTKIHIFDYDNAKQIGMEKAVSDLIGEIGLSNNDGDVDFGTFADRKPGNYCDTLLNEGAQKLVLKKQDVYLTWLQDTCSSAPDTPWCQDGNNLAAIQLTDAQQRKDKEASSTNRPESMLCIFEGDEGSSVMSEALGKHPQVYSPEWGREPVDKRFWKDQEYTLAPLLDNIRFLLRMPSSIKNFSIGRKKPITEKKYKQMVGNPKATYLKSRVCQMERRDPEEFKKCLTEAFDNLLCGEPGDTLDHLILPIRYGFDRACSKFVHRHKEIYHQVAQFSGIADVESKNLSQSITPEEAIVVRKGQETYIQDFMNLVRFAEESCPDQEHRVKIHIYDYDAAKEIGMEQALLNLFEEIGLDHDPKVVDLGVFGERKPGNYCETLLDKESQGIMARQEAKYNSFLQETCKEAPRSPWCIGGNNAKAS